MLAEGQLAVLASLIQRKGASDAVQVGGRPFTWIYCVHPQGGYDAWHHMHVVGSEEWVWCAPRCMVDDIHCVCLICQ